ncbi:MAG: helix-turn-helix domain-containing protein [Ktedonobacteraceae bacterium]
MPSQSYEARSERILDAAAELIVRWGYKKTTIDDIAKQAGVAKGTIYLHWKTREELFKAVLIHEELKLVEDMKQRIANDPEGATLHGMLKHATLATMKRPIWKAVMTRDTEMLGALVQDETATQRSIENFKVYFNVLREQGLIRRDLDMKQFLYLVSAITTGFLLVEPFLPEESKLADEVAVDLLADTIKRTFASGVPTTLDKRDELRQAFNYYMDDGVNILKEQEYKGAES